MKTHLRNLVRLLPVLVMLLAALAPSVHPRASAQAPTQSTEVELVGVIMGIERATLLTINDLAVDASRAEVKTQLAIGAVVKVEGALQTDGSILAREIYTPEDDLQPGEIELVGILQSLTTTTALVSGLGFRVAGAELAPGLMVGMLVKVHASLLPDNTWAAVEISPYVDDDSRIGDDNGNDNAADDNGNDNAADDNGNDNVGDGDASEDFKITGTLQEIGTDYVVIEGLRIVTAGAKLEPPLIVGTLVRAEVRLVAGTLVASEVKSAARDDDAGDDSVGDDSNDNTLDDNGNDNGDDNGNDNRDADDVCVFKVEASSANLRSGPGTGYSVIGFAFEDDEFAVQQIHSGGAWVQVLLPNQTTAWVALSVGEMDDCGTLPVATTQFRSGDDDGNDNGDDDGNDNGDDDGNDNGDDDNDNGDDDNDNGDDDNDNGDDDNDNGDDDGNDDGDDDNDNGDDD